MSIARFEDVTINTLTKSVSSIGQYSMNTTPLFTTRAAVKDVANSLRTTEKYRVYSDLVNLVLNYSPAMKDIVDNQNNYSLTWRNNDWRITDCRESNDRMSVTLMCYRVDPKVPV